MPLSLRSRNFATRAPGRGLLISAWLTALLLATGFFAYLNRASVAVRSGVQLDYGEGTVFWQAHNVLDPSRAVHPLGTYPFILFNYTPVYHYATQLMARVTPNLLAAGRMVSVLALLGICLLAGFIVKRGVRGQFGYAAGAMAGLFLFFLPNADWSLLMRVDTIGLFFTYLGLACFLASDKKAWLAYAAFTCFTLAAYSKQTLIAAPVACLIVLSFENRGRAWRALVVFAAEGLAVLGVAAWITHGELVRHLFTYNVSPLNWRHGLWLAADQCLRSAVFIAMALAYIAKLLYTGRGARTRTAVVVSVYFAIAVLASLSILKVGANINYLLEPFFVSCVLAALLVGEILRDADRMTDRAPYLAYGALAALAALALLYPRSGSGILAVRDTVREREADNRRIVNVVKALPGDVYSEDMTILLEAGKEVPGEPSSVTFLAAVGLWNEQALVRRFRERSFAAVVVDTSLGNREHFSPAVRGAVNSGYALKEKIGHYTIYLPKAADQNLNFISFGENHEPTIESVPQS